MVASIVKIRGYFYDIRCAYNYLLNIAITTFN